MVQDNDARMTRWSFWAGITFIILLALLHVIKSDIEPSWNFISEYQVGRFGWLMSLAFVSLGSSCLFLAIALWKEVNLVGKIGIVMMLLSSAGMFMAAIFKTDPLNTSPELVTQSGMLHQWGAMLDQIPFAALLITIALFRKKEWQRQPLAADRFIDFRVVRDDIFYSIYSRSFSCRWKIRPECFGRMAKQNNDRYSGTVGNSRG